MITFSGWGKFRAKKQPKVIDNWLRLVGQLTEARFKDGINGSHSGNVARRKDGSTFRRSTPSEFPARDSGALLSSIRMVKTNDSVTVGSNVFYSKFLRGGTKFMARRKMSDNALREGGVRASPASRGWVQWQKNNQ